MFKKYKVILSAFLIWAINIKIFLLLANWAQIALIYKFSDSVWNFCVQVFEYYYTFMITIPIDTILLSIIFGIMLFIFWYFYFLVFFNRIPETKIHSGAKYKILANVFTFLGFGCVACGQTLLYSILLFFGSNGAILLNDYIGNFSMLIGIIFLAFGIYENMKLYRNKNVCRI